MEDPNFIEVNEIDSIFKYLKSIEWSDPLIMGLVLFHLLVTLSSFLTRKCTNIQILLFLVLLLLVYCSETINEFAALNWQKFSRQQYFDSNGMFLSIVFSVPILLNCMFIVGSWLMESTKLMANVKQAQLRQELRRSKREKEREKLNHAKEE